MRLKLVACLFAGGILSHSGFVLAAKTARPPSIPTDIELSHQLDGADEKHLADIVSRFNDQQKLAHITLEKRNTGATPATLNFVTREELLRFTEQKMALKPLFQVMKESRESIDYKAISGDLKAGVVDSKGRFTGLPIAYSTPVLFYNKAAFRKVGLDPENPPKTWFEMQGVADKLQDGGYSCPYTSSWPAWIHIDNVSALSGVPVSTGKNNDLAFNGLPQVKHVAMMATWQKAKFFRSFGTKNDADEHFQSGECAMLTTNSSALAKFNHVPGIELGVAALPYHDDVYGGRQHTLADGGSLWVGAGFKPTQYKAAAKFVQFLLSPDVQIELARSNGILPMSAVARSALKSRLLKEENGLMEIVYASLRGEGATHPLRVSSIEPVRTIANQELEYVWSDKKPAKQALDEAVSRSNALLQSKPLYKTAIQ